MRSVAVAPFGQPRVRFARNQGNDVAEVDTHETTAKARAFEGLAQRFVQGPQAPLEPREEKGHAHDSAVPPELDYFVARRFHEPGECPAREIEEVHLHV